MSAPHGNNDRNKQRKQNVENTVEKCVFSVENLWINRVKRNGAKNQTFQ